MGHTNGQTHEYSVVSTVQTLTPFALCVLQETLLLSSDVIEVLPQGSTSVQHPIDQWRLSVVITGEKVAGFRPGD